MTEPMVAAPVIQKGNSGYTFPTHLEPLPSYPRVSALVGTLSLAESRPHSRGTLILLPRSEHLEAHAQVQLWTTTLTITQGSRMAPTVTSTTLRHSVSPSSSCLRAKKCPGSDSLNVCMKTTFIHINYTKGWAYRIDHLWDRDGIPHFRQSSGYTQGFWSHKA